MPVLRLDLSKTTQDVDPGLMIGSYQNLQPEDKSARFWGRRVARRLGVYYVENGAMFLNELMGKMIHLQSSVFHVSSSCTPLNYPLPSVLAISPLLTSKSKVLLENAPVH